MKKKIGTFFRSEFDFVSLKNNGTLSMEFGSMLESGDLSVWLEQNKKNLLKITFFLSSRPLQMDQPPKK